MPGIIIYPTTLPMYVAFYRLSGRETEKIPIQISDDIVGYILITQGLRTLYLAAGFKYPEPFL
jgi:hypothetical protein